MQRVLILDSSDMLHPVLKPCLRDLGYEVLVAAASDHTEYFYEPDVDLYSLEYAMDRIQPDIVVNCIATLVDRSEESRYDATLHNSFIPHYLEHLSNLFHFKLIHRSTDCIFEGTTGNYTEESVPDATSFYGRSKTLGEPNGKDSLTLRVSLVGPDEDENGDSLFPWFLRQSGEISGYSKVFWTGITTMEFARVLDKCIKNDLTGIYNVSNGEKISKADLLKLFAKYFPKEGLTIKDDASKTADKSLVASPKFDFEIPSYDEMIKNMQAWLKAHAELYPYLQERIK